MKTLTKLALAIAILTSVATTQAENVRGYFRSNGTYVMPYYRTPANGTPYDNLSYRGYPSQQPGYVSPRKMGFDSGFSQSLDSDLCGTSSRRNSSSLFDGGLQTMPDLGHPYKSRTLGY